MECPRCGFEQPKDQFCASCGLDIDHYVSKPKPALIRLIQNPNLHLSLIGILIVGVIGYIVYSQRELVSRQMGNLLDAPVSSRDAGDPNDPRNMPSQTSARSDSIRDQQPASEPEEAPEVASPSEVPASTGTPGELAGKAADADDAVAGSKLTTNQKLDVTIWEIPREALANLIALAEKAGESNAGRAYLFPTGSKIAGDLVNLGQKVSGGRSTNLKVGGQLTLETPPTAGEAFQFGLLFLMSRMDSKELNLKWDLQLVLPQPETAAEAASPNPTVRSTLESGLQGSGSLSTAGLLLIVIEPTNRTPREEFLARAGEGPWSIFSSQEFRSGITDWVVAVQVK